MFREQLEQTYYGKILGVRREYSNLNPVAASLLVWRSKLHTRVHRSRIDGYPLPKQGSAIIAGNHQDKTDNYKICIAVVRDAHRLIRAVAKKGSLVRGFSESPEFLKTIESGTPPSKYSAMKAYVLKGMGVIPVDRENPSLRFFKETDAVINSGQMLGIFLQPHWYRDCFLRNLQVGAATIARRHPDIPIYLCASSGPPYGKDKLTILQPFTYNQMAQELGRRPDVGELTIMFADSIARFQPQSVQDDWQTRRPKELTRLTSSK